METLYRLYGDSDQLLYVGISNQWRERFHQHEKSQTWWDEVCHISLERFKTRDEAAAAERIAIREELPAHNKQHSQTYETLQDHFDKLKFFIHYDVPVDELHSELIEDAKSLYAMTYFQRRGKKSIDVAGILRSVWSDKTMDDFDCRNCLAVATWGNLNRWSDLSLSKFAEAEGYKDGGV